VFFGRPGSGAIALVWPCRHRYAGLPLDQADSIRRPHSPHASSPASRYRRTTGSSRGTGPRVALTSWAAMKSSSLTSAGCAGRVEMTHPVQPPPLRRHEHRAPGAFADRDVDRADGTGRERDGHDFAALAGDDQRPVTPLQPQLLDIRPSRLGYPQPVQGEQRDQRMLAGGPSPAATSSAPSSLRSRATACDS
jgi:hypothetical protein